MGRALLVLTGLSMVAALTLFLFVEPVDIAAWLADPDALLVVVLVNLALLSIRLFSTGHAWWAGGGRHLAIVFPLFVLVAIPHVAIAWVGMETRQTLLEVFAPTPPPAAVAAVEPTTTTSTTLPTLDLTSHAPFPGQYESDPLDPVPVGSWRPFGEERLNILLLGGDAGPGRPGLRTDTVMVVSIDPVTGDTALFGIPRNFGGITFSDGSPVPVRRLNHVYNWGDKHPDAFGGHSPGASAVLDVVGHLTGLALDHFVLVDLTGFGDLVDVLGGVTLQVREPVYGPLYDTSTGGYEMVEIPSGSQTLDGGHALAFARARYGASDYARMARQRCILTALAAQADPISLLTRLPDVMGVIEQNMATDVPVERLPDLIRLLLLVSADEIRVVGFDSTWSAGRTPDGHPIPDVESIRELVRVTIGDPAAAVERGVPTAGHACA